MNGFPERLRRAKTVGGLAQTLYRGLERVRACFVPTMAADNLARLPRLRGRDEETAQRAPVPSAPADQARTPAGREEGKPPRDSD